eukprot:2644672-Pleurochrysis_carterae.AAC.6
MRPIYSSEQRLPVQEAARAAKRAGAAAAPVQCSPSYTQALQGASSVCSKPKCRANSADAHEKHGRQTGAQRRFKLSEKDKESRSSKEKHACERAPHSERCLSSRDVRARTCEPKPAAKWSANLQLCSPPWLSL